MATLVVKDGDLAGARFPVQSEAVLGRVDADVTIGDAQISRRHLKIYPGNEFVEVEDLGSTNGSWLNGQRLQGRMRMGPGDSLRVGETTLELEAATMTAGGTVIGAAPNFEELKRQADAEKAPPVPPAFGDAPRIEEHPFSKPQAPEAESPIEPVPAPPPEAPPAYEPPAAATPTWGDAPDQREAATGPAPGWEQSDDRPAPPAWGQPEQPQQPAWGQGAEGTAPMPQTGEQPQGGYQSGGYAPPGGFGQQPQPQGYGAPGTPFATKSSSNKRILLIVGGVVALIVIALAVYFFVFAEPTLDTAPIESQIEENLAADPNAQVDQVDCPDDVTVEEGGEFQCTASGPGGEFTVNLIQEDEEGNVRIVGVE
jgi:hypothetical protein